MTTGPGVVHRTRYSPREGRLVASTAVGMAFLADLTRQRSLASAAFLFLLLVDEIEGIAYLGVAVLLGRPELFLSMQQVFFPVVLFVAAAVSLARNWRRATPSQIVVPIESVELNALTQRIGAPVRARIEARAH